MEKVGDPFFQNDKKMNERMQVVDEIGNPFYYSTDTMQKGNA
jgi:hypothetical protein